MQNTFSANTQGSVAGLLRIQVQENLVLLLESTFKPMTITPKSTMEEIMYDAGKQHVIDFLRRQYEHNTNGTGI